MKLISREKYIMWEIVSLDSFSWALISYKIIFKYEK